jgi:hypothetical protein
VEDGEREGRKSREWTGPHDVKEKFFLYR